MRKNLLLIVCALVCGVIMIGCGGGEKSGGSSGKLKKNEYLGNLPALYESYSAETDAYEKKLEAESEKLMAGGEKNYAKIQKLFDDQKTWEKARRQQFEADVKAEMEKIVGKEIPVTFSDKLKNSGELYYVPSVKIAEQRGEPRLAITITAKDDFTVASMKSYDYTIYFRLTGKDGAALQHSASTIIPIKLERQAQSFSKGDVLIDSYVAYGFNLGRYAADRAAFSGVEFITEEEYNAANQ